MLKHSLCLVLTVVSFVAESQAETETRILNDEIEKLGIALNNFEDSLDAQTLLTELRIEEIEVQVNEVEREWWYNSVEQMGQSVYLDGLSISELFPNCVADLQQSYNKGRTNELSVASCVTMSQTKAGSAATTTYVSEIAPLGVT